MARKVYLAQLKCPSNHCVLGLSGEFGSPEEAAGLGEKLMGTFLLAVEEKLLNHECAICRSKNLAVVVEPTRFNTMAEAEPHLRASERDQMESAAMLRRSRN